jgi:MFS family permease
MAPQGTADWDTSYEWRTVALLGIGFGLVGLDRWIIASLFPAMAMDLGLPEGEIGRLAGILGILWGVFAIFSGRLSDAIGHPKVLIPAIVLFSLMSGFSGLVQGLVTLVWIRAIMGAMEGTYCPTSFTAVAAASKPARRGFNQGLQQSGFALMGFALGPIIATQLLNVVPSWRWVFWICAIPGFVVGVLLYFHLREPKDTQAGALIGATQASGAWLDPSVLPYALSYDASLTFQGGLGSGRWTDSYTCDSWTSANASSFSNTYLAPTGQIATASSNTAPLPPGCNTLRSLACCNGTPKAQFAGFTSMITNGGSIAGGRPGMHGVCASEFTGSHMCHAAEYIRAASGVTIPSSGAWLDPSVNERDELVLGGSPRFGRWTSSYTCNGWTSASGTSFSSTFLDADGDIKTHSSNTAPLPVGCAAQRPIACCR